MRKKILFITGTRADFGKLKSLIRVTKKSKKFDVKIVATGMHNIAKFGSTYTEVVKTFGKGIIRFKNQSFGDNLDEILKNTIFKFSKIVKRINPDLIVIHGDRIETLACALVGSMNHILTAHVEGGELSGTIDDTIRHTVTKLSHIHFVGSDKAVSIVRSMGEKKESIYKIGSPDMDILMNKNISSMSSVRKRYKIGFNNYAILLWHPVTSELKTLRKDTEKLVKFINKTKINFFVFYPNNDPGAKIILDIYKKFLNKRKARIFQNIRFEFFISLLKNAKFIIGNSSSAIYAAPILKTPAANIGTRQRKRLSSKSIKNLKIKDLKKIKIERFLKNYISPKVKYYGDGRSDKRFFSILNSKKFWKTPTQKSFYQKK